MKHPFIRIISWIAFLLPLLCMVLFFVAFDSFYIYSISLSFIDIVMGSFGIKKAGPKNSKDREDMFNRLLISGGTTFSVLGLLIYGIALIVMIATGTGV